MISTSTGGLLSTSQHLVRIEPITRIKETNVTRRIVPRGSVELPSKVTEAAYKRKHYKLWE